MKHHGTYGGLFVRAGSIGALALLLAACGSSTAKVDPNLGVAPSPRVVAEGQAVPRGGGRAMVGRPYTIGGRTFVPQHDPNYTREGLASWYGRQFHGRSTANGEVFDRFSMTAAHPTMPLPSYARVTNLENGHSVIVRVNDRGPFHGNRIIDVSRTVADTLDFRNAGLARVRVDYVGPASVHGSDDRILMASLRTDGRPADMPVDGGSAIQIAAADRPVAPSLSFASAPATVALPAATRPAVQPAAVVAPLADLPLPPARPDFGALVVTQASLRGQPTPTQTPASSFAPQPVLRGAVPVGSAPLRAAPSQLVGIFFASPDRPAAGFVKNGTFGAVLAQPSLSLRGDR